MPEPENRPPKPSPLPEDRGKTSGGALAGLGVQFAAAIVGCVLLGNWIDGRYGTRPWGVLIGAAVGFASGFYSIFRAAKAEEARDSNERTRGK